MCCDYWPSVKNGATKRVVTKFYIIVDPYDSELPLCWSIMSQWLRMWKLWSWARWKSNNCQQSDGNRIHHWPLGYFKKFRWIDVFVGAQIMAE